MKITSQVSAYKAVGPRPVVASRLMAVVVLCSLLCFAASSFAAEPRGEPSIGESFDGEELNYKMGFWVLSGVAKARLTFKKEEGSPTVFVATFSAHTTGVVRFVRDRADRLTARMEVVDGGRRLRTLSFEKYYVLGKKNRRKLIVMDYDKGVMRWTKWRGGKFSKSGVVPIPEGVIYDDPLAAFYNLRYGAYGSVESTEVFTIKTLPNNDGKDVDIEVRFASPDEFEKQGGAGKGAAAYLAYARLDKELFDSNSGDIEIFFGPRTKTRYRDMVVTYAVAKDVLFFGDVRGRLIP